MSELPTTPETITRLIGVYDADSTIVGEVAYWLGARLGRRHCSLCDITHTAVRTKSEWKQCRTEFPVPFETFHRDDQPDAVRVATNAQAPVVVAETTTRFVVLLGDTQLRACAGSIEQLQSAIDVAVAATGLNWATGWA